VKKFTLDSEKKEAKNAERYEQSVSKQ